MIHKFICPTAGNCTFHTCFHKEEHERSDECAMDSRCPACTRYTGIIPMNIWETLRHNINQVQGENLGSDAYPLLIFRSRLQELYDACHYKTIDNYLYHLRKAGYLDTVGRGIYQRRGEIPHMSLTELRNESSRPLWGVDIAANFESIAPTAGFYRVDSNNDNQWSINAETNFGYKDPEYGELTLEQKKKIFRDTYNIQPETEEFLTKKDMQIE
jgi:hypothetical protein